MSKQRCSTDLIVTEQDFTECGWRSSLADEEREGFEIKALYCNALRPDLRNELALGLLDDDSFQSIDVELRLVFNTFWNAASKVDGGNGVEENNDN